MEPPNKGMQTDGRFAAAADRRGVRHSVSQDAIEELLNCVLRTTRDKSGGPLWTAVVAVESERKSLPTNSCLQTLIFVSLTLTVPQKINAWI